MTYNYMKGLQYILSKRAGILPYSDSLDIMTGHSKPAAWRIKDIKHSVGTVIKGG